MSFCKKKCMTCTILLPLLVLVIMVGIAISVVPEKSSYKTNFTSTNILEKTVSLTSSSCPAECHCIDVVPSSYILVACENGLQNLPTYCPPQTEVFAYTHSELPFSTLTSSSLLQFSSVKILNLSNNNIKYISNGTFNALKKLVYLYLDNNPIISEFNKNFLRPVSRSLKVLSLKRVLPNEVSENLLWEVVFGDAASEKTLLFANLNELQLDGNRMTYIDINLLNKSSCLTSLSVLGLAKNNLDLKVILPLLNLKLKIYQIKMLKSLQKSNLNSISNIEKAKFLHTNKLKASFTVDMRKNHLTFLNASTITELELLYLNDDSNSLKIQLALMDNPWNCSCEILPLTNFISRGNGKSLIKDWKSLKCASPIKFVGRDLELHRIDHLPKNFVVCSGNSEGSVMQLIFIVLSAVGLTAVTAMVVFLNRRKVVRYYGLIKNCGEERDPTTSVRWKNNLDKYTIPSDHKGKMHQRYRFGEASLTCKDMQKLRA